MKKKTRILIISLSALVLIGAAGVYASGLGSEIWEQVANIGTEEKTRIIREDQAAAQQAEDQARKEQGAQAIDAVAAGEAAQLNMFDQMRLVMDATIEDPTEYNDNLFNYVYLQDVHGLSQEQMDYIAGLVVDGCDMKTVIEIAYFWLDTNEDITMIGDIYDLKSDYAGGRTWIENAFNRLTNDKCGVLTSEDIDAYNSQGISTQEILIANRLCRKGVLTIQEILQARLEGKGFAEISALINGENTAGILSAAGEGEAATAAAVTGDDVLLSYHLESITGVSHQEYQKQAAEGQDLNTAFREANAEKNQEIQSWLRRENMFKAYPEDEEEAEQEAVEQEPTAQEAEGGEIL